MSLTRLALANFKRFPRCSTWIRTFSDKKDGGNKQDGGDKKVFTFPDLIEHATGEEKMLLLLEEQGITDPFFENHIVRFNTTKTNMIKIPSFENKRLVGCICEEDATYVNYMWLHKGDPKRCECGYWFEAIDAPDYFKDLKDPKA